MALQRLENSAFPVSSLKALPRNLSCTRVITTGVLGGRLNTSRLSSSNIQRFPACKGDPSATLGMTVRESSLSVSLVTSHSSLIPAFKFRGWRIALFPYRHFERSREIFLAHRLSRRVSLAAGSILLVSRHQTPSVFLPARGIPRLRSG